jgi:hypothetical protein
MPAAASSVLEPVAAFLEYTGIVSALPYTPGVELPEHTSYVLTLSPEYVVKMPAHPT